VSRGWQAWWCPTPPLLQQRHDDGVWLIGRTEDENENDRKLMEGVPPWNLSDQREGPPRISTAQQQQ
jgi:hypothetical protein